MRKIYYDTEFIDNGSTIELISIGMVADDGEEFYRINSDLPPSRLIDDNWHFENTVPSLPIGRLEDERPGWVPTHRDYGLLRSKDGVRDDVYDFILRKTPIGEQVELWAWYGAYDHVVLAQLWGPMNKLPRIVPMYTNDLKQEMTRKEILLGTNRLHFDMPKMNGGNVHNALDDARLIKKRAEWLEQF